MSQDLVVAVDQRVARLTLNRPAARNALTRELWSEIAGTVGRLDDDGDVAAIVLTGADPAFCAGFDLRRLSSEPREDQRARQQRPPDFLGMLPPCDTPIIAAVNGPAVTGGLELALGCDFLIASDRARFADTHARVGVMPGGGLTIRLPALIGPARALQMSMTGDFIDAETACRWGLVNEVVPHDDLLDRATELARSIASIPRGNIVELRSIYSEVAGLSGHAAWAREGERAREWMRLRFDQDRLASEKDAIIERGRAQR